MKLTFILIFICAIGLVYGQPQFGAGNQEDGRIKLIYTLTQTIYDFDTLQNQPRFEGGNLPYLQDIKLFHSKGTDGKYYAFGSLMCRFKNYPLPSHVIMPDYRFGLPIFISSLDGKTWSKNLNPGVNYKEIVPTIPLSDNLFIRYSYKKSDIYYSSNHGDTWNILSKIATTGDIKIINYYQDLKTNNTFLYGLQSTLNNEGIKVLKYDFKLKSWKSILTLNNTTDEKINLSSFQFEIAESGVLFYGYLVSIAQTNYSTFIIKKSIDNGTSWDLAGFNFEGENIQSATLKAVNNSILVQQSSLSRLKSISNNKLSDDYLQIIRRFISINSGFSWKELPSSINNDGITSFIGNDNLLKDTFLIAQAYNPFPNGGMTYVSKDLIEWINVPNYLFVSGSNSSFIIVGKNYANSHYYILKVNYASSTFKVYETDLSELLK